MAPVQTFVFFDIATKREDNADNCDEIKALCFLAVPRQQYLEPNNIRAPNDGNQIYMEFPNNEITVEDFNTINNFINQQEKPVCIMAHNGNRFDFGILKRKFNRLNVDLASDVLVADTMYAFHDILENRAQGNAVRRFYWEPHPQPANGYKLHDVYTRVVTNNPVEIEPHPPQNDTYMLFRISHALGQRFLNWADNPNRQRRFVQVQPNGIQI
ncbi:three prime repair exonuclease 2-like [Spodoptera litura]|uniref:Three prime repair exonuclease 2-like n=1 Tax=Spodoptera litura TaxID=69820 RepID=A0A9J7EL31_SPOLT|nr:three prime repair exonuclease 2-like [Spodoptera litura]